MKYNFSLLILSFFLISCVTPPINDESLNLDSKNTRILIEEPNIKIYFPQFFPTPNKSFEGDGIIIILPDNKCIVLDGFVKEAEEKYISFIKSLGISRIDYLIASHYHADHIGSFSTLIDTFEIGAFYSNGIPINTDTSNNLVKKLKDNSIESHIFRESDIYKFSENCNLQVFGPIISDNEIHNAYYNPGKTAKLINSTSLVFKLNYINFSILFTGDMYRNGMKKICKKYKKEIKSEIVKSPHHGDWATTNSLYFINKVDAKYAIIQDTRYITNTLFFRYKLNGTKILYRSTEGYIEIESDGINFNISENSQNF